jgi:hypothetical protein
MPRLVVAHHLEQLTADVTGRPGGRASQQRLYLLGTMLFVGRGAAEGPRRWSPVTPGPVGPGVDRDRHLLGAYAARYRLITQQTFTVPAVLAGRAGHSPGLLDDAFDLSWSAQWQPLLEELTRAAHADGATDGTRQVVVLTRFTRYVATRPWGQRLTAELAGAGLSVDVDTGTALAAVGPAVQGWLGQHYEPALEGPPPTVSGVPGDTDQVLQVAVRLWNGGRAGPLSALAAALDTARDMLGVPIP